MITSYLERHHSITLPTQYEDICFFAVFMRTFLICPNLDHKTSVEKSDTVFKLLSVPAVLHK